MIDNIKVHLFNKTVIAFKYNVTINRDNLKLK